MVDDGAAGTPSPPTLAPSDGESAGHPADSSASPRSTADNHAADRAMEYEEDDEEDEGEGIGGATPANDSEEASRPSTPARARSSIPTKRRAGRPPRTRGRLPTANDESETRDAGSDAGTPRRRGGWRGRGFGGGRWGKPRGGPSHVTQVPLDKEGNMANVKDDEIELPSDPDGETKVDKNGVLLGDREYKVRVFTISGKGDRLYMLSTEPARCIGFRDSYLFFQKHKTLWKIILTEEAKRDLIERSLIPHSYKGRAIGVVTARSVFREFGAKIVIGGKKVLDDYQVAAARGRGDVEGELAAPEDKLPGEGDTYDKNRFVAWHGASSVYHSGGPSMPLPNGKVLEGKKRRVIVTGSNWMLEHAREARYESSRAIASRFNSSIAATRRSNLEGTYDAHTNVAHYPRSMQPTHARWEACGHIDGSPSEGANEIRRADSKFPRIPSILQRNFLISDTCYVSPPVTGFAVPGSDGNVLDVGAPGSSATSENVAVAMPSECQQALDTVRQEVLRWKDLWHGEGRDGARAQLQISYNQ
ncbi:MAG: hypothetical protein LQ348_000234 [Seirophora lacunosa]|nr:MAG: hypothetical protein LQ348_000234 [Seirophora lacunosa]